MITLLRIECSKAFRNKWFAVALSIGIALALAASHDNVANYLAGGFDELDPDEYQFPTGKSCFSMWMGISSMSVSPARELFFFAVPLLAVIPYAWSMRSELSNGYALQVFSRVPRGHYIAAKATAIFLTGGLIALVPLVVNFVAVACFVPARATHIYDVMYVGVTETALWASLFYTHPFAFVLARCALDFVLCGTWSLFVFGLSFAIKNRIVLLVSPYVGLFALTFVNHHVFYLFGSTGLQGFELSLFDLLQCLTMYYPHNGWAILAGTVTLAFFALFLSYRGSRGDVL